MLKKFTISYRDDNEIVSTSIQADVVQTKPFGLFVLNTKKNTERFFSNRLWTQVEFGTYQKINPKYKVTIDSKEYIVSAIEFDASGTLTLSVFKETKSADAVTRDNQWMLIMAPGTFDYVQTSKL